MNTSTNQDGGIQPKPPEESAKAFSFLFCLDFKGLLGDFELLRKCVTNTFTNTNVFCKCFLF